MLSIGEFARAVELSVSAVRFYADRGVLTPAATDPTTGYRFYTDEQISIGALIRELRRIEMSLVEIAGVLEMSQPARDQAVHEHLERLEHRLEGVRAVAQTLVATADPRTDPATTLRSADFARAINQVLPAAGRDPRHPHHMCVLIELKGNSLRLAATDSHRLAIRDLLPTTAGSMFSVIVAAATLQPWPEALARTDGITIDLADEMLRVRGRGLDLFCPTVPTVFPDYEAVLQRSPGLTTTITTDRHQLLSMIKGFEGDDTVVLSTSGSELVVTCNLTRRAVAAEATGPDTRITINPRYAADAVENAVGADLIIEIDDPLQPLTFRSADDGTYTSLLMPVKPD